MDRLNVYSIYDKLTDSYGVPFFDVNHKCAIRRVRGCYQNNPFIDGLSLFFLGTFCSETGVFAVAFPDEKFDVPLSDLLSEVPENGKE